MSPKNIVVFGAGALGSLVAAYLNRAGHLATVVDPWYAHMVAIQRDGLHVTDPDEEFTVRMRALHHDWLREAAPIDILFLSVKSMDTEQATRYVAPYLSPDGFIVSAQNSLNEEIISSIVGPERTIGMAATRITCAVYEPGVLLRYSSVRDKVFQVGELDGSTTPRLQEVAGLMSNVAGASITGDIWGALWTKLAVNCMGNALAGLTGQTATPLASSPIARRVRMLIGKEVVEVGEAYGIKFGNIGGFPPEYYKDVDGPGGQAIEKKALEDAVRSAGKEEHKPSLLQDVIKRRRSEVDYLNGLIVRKGEQVGMPAPVNAATTEAVHRIDTGDLKPDMANLELFRELV